MLKKRINLPDDELEKIVPIAVFFDAIPDEKFVDCIEGLTKGHGAFFNYGGCMFPADLDEYMISHDEGFENGVQFIDIDDELTVDMRTFRKYLEMACEGYWQERPEKKETLQRILKQPQAQPDLPPDVAEWTRKLKAGEYDYLKALQKIEK